MERLLRLETEQVEKFIVKLGEIAIVHEMGNIPGQYVQGAIRYSGSEEQANRIQNIFDRLYSRIILRFAREYIIELNNEQLLYDMPECIACKNKCY